MPANDCQQLYSNLVTAVIRVGQADDALSLMKERKSMFGWAGILGWVKPIGVPIGGNESEFCCSYHDMYQDTRVQLFNSY